MSEADMAECVKKSGIYLRGMIMAYQIAHGLFTWYVLIPFLFSKNEFMEWVSRVYVIVIYPMLVLTHCVTSSIKSHSFRRKRETAFMNRKELVLYNTCKKCGEAESWKPLRTKHCKMQGRDVTRFDHFCPVTLNTIGYRNHSVFVKTAILHFITTTIWLIMFFFYLTVEVFDRSKFTSGTSYMFCIVLSFADIFFILILWCMSSGISMSHLWFIASNTTTIDMISKGSSWTWNREFGTYNLGFIYNIGQYFPKPLWLCCCPIPNDTDVYEGYWYPQVGVPRELFAMIIAEKGITLKPGELPVKLPHEELIKEAQKIYEGTTLTLGNTKVVVSSGGIDEVKEEQQPFEFA